MYKGTMHSGQCTMINNEFLLRLLFFAPLRETFNRPHFLFSSARNKPVSEANHLRETNQFTWISSGRRMKFCLYLKRMLVLTFRR
jgi:hypothetical protein